MTRGENKNTMKTIILGDDQISGIDPQVFDDLITCASVAVDGACDAIGDDRADAVFALINRIVEMTRA